LQRMVLSRRGSLSTSPPYMSFAESYSDWLLQLQPGIKLPRGTHWLNPYEEQEIPNAVRSFYNSFYKGKRKRILLLGINPGRLGAGLTGIAFTDPVQLTRLCGKEYGLPQKAEHSATFIHAMIETYGGMHVFARHFLLAAMCPLGLIKDGKNYNYYDDPALLKSVTPFIEKCIDEQLAIGGRTDAVICIGEGKNRTVLENLNSKKRWFRSIHTLPHPRWVMQYRRKHTDFYVSQYVNLLQELG